MNADKALAAETVVALAAVTAGDLLAQGANRSLPNPRRIVGTLIFYSILSLGASFSAGFARFAAAVGAVVVLATLVLGPGGKAVTTLIGSATSLVETPAGQPSQAPPGTTAATGAPTPTASVQSRILGSLKSILQFSPIAGLPF